MKPLGHMVSEMSSMVTRLSLEAVEMVEWQRRRSRFILLREMSYHKVLSRFHKGCSAQCEFFKIRSF